MNPHFRAWTCMGSLLLCGAGAVCAPIYQSGFGRLPEGSGTVPDWHLSGGDWRIASGLLTVRSDKSNPFGCLEVTHDGDGTFRATVRNARSCHRAGILAKGVYRLETNRQFVALQLLRQRGDDWVVVSQAPDPWLYARNTQQFELRLAFSGRRIVGFVDDKQLVEYDDPEPPPLGGAYGLVGGWGTDLAWAGVELSDEVDISQWPYEAFADKAPEGLVRVVSVRGEDEHGVCFDGDSAALHIVLTTERAREIATHLRLRLIDVRQREAARTVARVSLKPGEETELTAEFVPPARGCFKVALDAGESADALGWVEDLGGFTVLALSLAETPALPGSVFGGHMDGINYKWHFQAGRIIGLQWARCHDMLQTGWWTRIQPDGPEQWRWPYDEAQWELDDRGFSTLGEFLWTPRWASGAPAGADRPEAYPPADWEAFRRYVAQLVAHYQGSITHWEVWNEPHYSGFWRGTPEQYAELLRIAYTEAKRVDPDCTILGGGGVNLRSMDWVRRMLRAGAGPYMDAFSIHYLEPDCASEQIAELRRLLDAAGMEGPIWNTEESVPSTSFLDQLRADCAEPEARYHFRNACYELVRTYMENLANDVRRVFYYEQADPWRMQAYPKPQVPDKSEIGGGMWEQGRTLRPIAAAHAALVQAIEGKRYMTRIDRGDLQVFIFEGASSATAVQYALFPSYARRDAMRLRLTGELTHADFSAMDFMGNEAAPATDGGCLLLPLAREPVYLMYRGRRAGDVLRQMYAGAAGQPQDSE